MITTTKKAIRALTEIHKAHLTNHISDLWDFIVSSEPVIDYTNATGSVDEDKNDFRYKTIGKWKALNTERMNLDFGYFDNSGSRFILVQPKDNAYIKPSEAERQNLIQSYINSINEIIGNQDLQKHKVLINRTKEIASEVECINPDLKNRDDWKKVCKRWGVIDSLTK
ncbi:MAG: hypothetical protein UX81_C0008G0012 [Parcubacteria group bacterium GW2011_GWA2_47_12]|nr:MAG: hypothetical protein UX81_C0008G0012 [Parcubacteria group bacterium GW2011_GWA2_47_12]